MNETWRILFKQYRELFLEQSKLNYLIGFGLGTFPDSNIERGYLRRSRWFLQEAEQDKRADRHRENNQFNGRFHRTFLEARSPLVGWSFKEFGYGAIWGDERGVSQFLNLANQVGAELPWEFVPDDPLFPPIEPNRKNWAYPDPISRWLQFVYTMRSSGFSRTRQRGTEWVDGGYIDLNCNRIVRGTGDPFLLSADVLAIALEMDSSTLLGEYQSRLERVRSHSEWASNPFVPQTHSEDGSQMSELPTARIARYRAIAQHIEAIAETYQNTIEPLQCAFQSVLNAIPIECEPWKNAIREAADQIRRFHLESEVESILVRRCQTLTNSHRYSRAIACQAITNVLLNATADNIAFDAFRERLSSHPKASNDVETEQHPILGWILNQLRHRESQHHVPRLNEYAAELNVADWLIPSRLAQAGITLSDNAIRALKDWEEVNHGGEACFDGRLNANVASESATLAEPVFQTDESKNDGGSPNSLPETLRDEGEKPQPDGIFGVDGFRFAGIEVSFGRAGKQYSLIKALWDDDRKEPRQPTQIQTVIEQVYGEGSDTSDAAFRQLLSDTRKRFQAANFPADLDSANGLIRLVRV